MPLVTAPTPRALDALRERTTGIDTVLWDFTTPPPADRIDMAIAPYMAPAASLAPVADANVGVLHLLSIGFDGVRDAVGADILICNAAGAHEEATAELALAMILASRRGIPGFVRAQDCARWEQRFSIGLRGQRALVIGAGGVGTALTQRLLACGVHVERVGRSARRDELGRVIASAEMREHLPTSDIVVLAVPLTAETKGLVDAEFLAALPDDALIVNVARGPVVDTAALTAQLDTGRLFAALDVVDPEPLPADHPLWSQHRALIIPHVGGRVDTMHDALDDLLADQVERLRGGQQLRNVLPI